MKFFIDECLSPLLALRLNETGRHDAIHPPHVGRRGESDHRVLARSIREQRTIVTENAGDFLKLMGRTQGHPGLILLPSTDRETSWLLLQRALTVLDRRGDPALAIAGGVLEIDLRGRTVLRALPSQ